MVRQHDGEDRPDRSAIDVLSRMGLGRRPVLKALGVGAGLSLAGGTAAATTQDGGDGDGGRGDGDGDGGGGDGGEQPRPPHIHPFYGYPSSGQEEPPQRLQPDHAVQLLVRFPPGVPPMEGENGSDGDTEPPELDHPPLFHFEPAGLHVDPGDIVQFRFSTPDHTVTAYHPGHGFQRRVPDCNPPFSSPVVNAGGYWLYQFDDPGVYDMYCAPHHPFGMVLRIVVGDLDEEDLPAYVGDYEPDQEESPLPLQGPFSEEEIETFIGMAGQQDIDWPFPAPLAVLDTDALDPMAIQSAGSVAFAGVAEELGYDLDPD